MDIKENSIELYEALLRKGVFAKYKKRTHDAIVLLSKAISIRPDHYECYLQKGLAYFAVDQKNLAIQYIEEGYKKCRKTMSHSEKRTLKGLLYELVDKDYNKALDEYKHAVKIDHKNDFAYNAIGYIYHIQKKFKLAIEYYFKAIKCNPKYGSCVMYCNIGLCFEKLNDKSNTLKFYGKSINANKEYLEAYIYRSQFYSEIGAKEKAKIDLKEVLRIDPINSLAVALMGDIYYDEKDEKKAVLQYRKAHRLDPTVGSYYEILGSWELYKFGNEEKAFDIVNQGLNQCFLNDEIVSLLKVKSKFALYLYEKYENKDEKIAGKFKQIQIETKKLMENWPENRYKVLMKDNILEHLKSNNEELNDDSDIFENKRDPKKSYMDCMIITQSERI